MHLWKNLFKMKILVIDIWGDIETYIAVMNEELKLREIEITREALEDHDQRILNIYNVEVVPLLTWCEELLVMKAFLTNDFYMKGSFTDELKLKNVNVFTLLDRNLLEKLNTVMLIPLNIM